jgi:hypothetical protein
LPFLAALTTLALDCRGRLFDSCLGGRDGFESPLLGSFRRRAISLGLRGAVSLGGSFLSGLALQLLGGLDRVEAPLGLLAHHTHRFLKIPIGLFGGRETQV